MRFTNIIAVAGLVLIFLGPSNNVWSTDQQDDLVKESPLFVHSTRHHKEAMIDHISYSVNNFSESVAFYDETLKILGYERLVAFDFSNDQRQVTSYGKNGRPSFWIHSGQESVGKVGRVHVAFSSPNVDAVDRWYNKALELGGGWSGKPGRRKYYHPKCYAAYIIDPSGWKIMACFLPYTPPSKPFRPIRHSKQAMIDHISYSVNDFFKSETFYNETLKILGYERLDPRERLYPDKIGTYALRWAPDGFDNFYGRGKWSEWTGYGKDGRPSFWIYSKDFFEYHWSDPKDPDRDPDIARRAWEEQWLYHGYKGDPYLVKGDLVNGSLEARGFHVAFSSPSTDAVDRWHEKALELGGRDNGKPGSWPKYHPKYYAAFIIDPSGWKIEACFLPYESPAKL